MAYGGYVLRRKPSLSAQHCVQCMRQVFDIGIELIDFGLHSAQEKPADENGKAIIANSGYELLYFHSASIKQKA